MEKVKRQHYVPRCYLENFKIPISNQIHVYDIEQKKKRIANIKDIAVQNYFYDIEISKKLKENSVLLEQGIEKFFGNKVEPIFAEMLRKLINTVDNITPWETKNCLFFSESQKIEFSKHLVYQTIRTKFVRDDIQKTNNIILRLLENMNVPENKKVEYILDDEKIKNVHLKMLMDDKEIQETSEIFNNFIWILGINKTKENFYKSDSPILRIPHVKDTIVSMSGLASLGIEVIFPISSNIILIMLDGNFHKVLDKDRTYLEIDNENIVKYYNLATIRCCNRCVFSSDGNFELINSCLKINSNSFNNKRVEVRWGDKIFLE